VRTDSGSNGSRIEREINGLRKAKLKTTGSYKPSPNVANALAGL
jgi:hypothetical protein